MDKNQSPEKASTKSKQAEKEVPENMRIELFAKRYQWIVRYAGDDNVLGDTYYGCITEENPLGLMTKKSFEIAIDKRERQVDSLIAAIDQMDKSNPMRDDLIYRFEKEERRLFRLHEHLKLGEFDEKKSFDDMISTDTLFLCKGMKTTFVLRSGDDIHSAYFPELRVQMNVVPGMQTRMTITPELTTEEMRLKRKQPDFQYQLICNKVCGEGYRKMKMPVVILEPKAFGRRLKQLSTVGEEGLLL